MRPRWISLLLFLIISSIYYATSSGITSSNDGSHYALLRAIVDEGRFRIETYAQYAEGNDLAIRDEVWYSDRPPGTALLDIPFYVAGGVLPPPIQDLPTRHDEGNPRLAYVVMLPVHMGAGTAVILYHMLRSYDLSQFAAITATLAFALGTTIWKYSSVLYSHAPSALLTLGAVALALSSVRQGRLQPGIAALLGFMLGLGIAVEYSTAVLVGLIVIYLAAVLRTKLICGGGWALAAALFAAGFAVPIAFLMYYNTMNFGGPLVTSYQYAINYPWAASLGTTFDVPLSRGLPAMLWYGIDLREQENQGLFLLTPVTLIGLAGVWAYIKRRRQEAILVLGVFLIYLLLFAKHHTFSGFTFDGRYLMPFLALWFVPIGFALDALDRKEESAGKAALLLIVYGLIFLSVRNMLAHIAFSYNYHLDPGLVQRRAATPENWGYILGNIFVNWQNLPLLWLVEGAAPGIGILAWRWTARRPNQHVAADPIEPVSPQPT